MMSHPLYQKPANRFYLIIWSVISIGHFCIFYFFYNFSILASALDSLIFNTLYFGLGLGIWYLVRFNPLNKRLSRTILNHAISGVIAVILWASIGKSLIGILPIEDKAYENFLANSNLGRNLIGFALYALFSLSFYLIEHYESLQDRIREELELKALVNEAHLKSLKSQINPHFLFNSLNSINSLTLVSPEKTRDMVIKLSEFLRYSAGKQSQEHATLEEELRHMNIYLDIEKVRFGKKLDIETSIALKPKFLTLFCSHCLKMRSNMASRKAWIQSQLPLSVQNPALSLELKWKTNLMIQLMQKGRESDLTTLRPG